MEIIELKQRRFTRAIIEQIKTADRSAPRVSVVLGGVHGGTYRLIRDAIDQGRAALLASGPVVKFSIPPASAGELRPARLARIVSEACGLQSHRRPCWASTAAVVQRMKQPGATVFIDDLHLMCRQPEAVQWLEALLVESDANAVCLGESSAAEVIRSMPRLRRYALMMSLTKPSA